MRMLRVLFVYVPMVACGYFSCAEAAHENQKSSAQISESHVLQKDNLQSTNCRPCRRSNPNLFNRAYRRLHQIWYEGHRELYIPFYAWHNRYVYSSARIKTYNENPWGGGLGKGFYDEKGNWHGLYAFAFLDSHKNVEPIIGYAFLKAWHPHPYLMLGGGYAVLATMRPDINHGIPFPGVLPWVSLSYRRVSLIATYIPGHQNAGNVLFLITKITL